MAAVWGVKGWSLVEPALSAELDALQPKLRKVTIYLDLDGGEAFAFDEDNTDLKTFSVWQRSVIHGNSHLSILQVNTRLLWSRKVSQLPPGEKSKGSIIRSGIRTAW